MTRIETFTRRLPELLQDQRVQRQVLGGMGVLASLGAGLAGYALFREPLTVRPEQIAVRLPGSKGRLPSDGLRILHLSDTHFQGHDWRERVKIDQIHRLTAGLDVDLLVHTGDFLHCDRGLGNVERLLDGLPRPKIGSYAVFGNHDYTVYSHDKLLGRAWVNFRERETVRRESQGIPASPTALGHLPDLARFGRYFLDVPLDLKRTGRNDVEQLATLLSAREIQILHNRSLRLRTENGSRGPLDFYLAGVDDVTEGSPNVSRALASIPGDAPTVLLSHNPDILEEPGLEEVDLILSGHTHGGQIVLPLFGAAHTQSRFLARHEVSGYMRHGDTQVYITRGIGEGIPLRFGACPEITLITLLPD